MSVIADGVQQGALGVWDLTLDVEALSGTMVLHRARDGASNADVHLLPVTYFLKADSLVIESVRWNSGQLEIGYAFTHPVADSPLSGRADLGFSGFLMLLADIPTAVGNTYFTEQTPPVQVNTRALGNADAYYQPRGLLSLPGFTANAFPYRVLVDETGTGNRYLASTDQAISNGLDPRGNFQVPIGWQTGASSSWTGYGVLHQGQRVRGVLQVHPEFLGAQGVIQAQIVCIAKHSDPRAGTPAKDHRLPFSPPRVITGFGYRLPHGALDADQIAFEGVEGTFIANADSSSVLRYHVRDWDGRSMETSLSDLKNELDTSLVAQGETGAPSLEVSIPGVLDQSVALGPPVDDDWLFGGDFTPDSGRPGDEFFYQAAVTNDFRAGQLPGTYTGMVRATDPEISGQPYLIPLNENLGPMTDPPLPLTYQAFQVTVAERSGWAVSYRGTGQVLGYDVAVLGNGEVVTVGRFTGEADFGRIPGPTPAVGPMALYVVLLAPDGQFNWEQIYPCAGNIESATVVATPNGGFAIAGQFNGTMDFGGGPRNSGAEDAPFLFTIENVGGSFGWDRTWATGGSHLDSRGVPSVATDATGSVSLFGPFRQAVDFGGGTRTPVGGTDLFLVKLTADGSYLLDRTWGSTGDEVIGAIATTPLEEVIVGGGFQDSLDFGGGVRTTSNLNGIAAFILKLDADGDYLWDRTFGGAFEVTRALAVDSTQSIYTAGDFQQAINFGGGPRPSSSGRDLFLLKLDPAGSYLWDRTWARPDYINTWGSTVLMVDQVGRPTVGGTFQGIVDWGGGPTGGQSAPGTDGFLVQLESDAMYRWDHTWGATPVLAWTSAPGGAVGPTGHLYVTGNYETAVDFEPGPGQTVLPFNGLTNGYVMKVSAAGTW